MATQLMPTPAKGKDDQYNLKKLVIAHDSSDASQRALEDAIFLAKKFHAEVLVAHVQSMTEETVREENQDNRIDLQSVGTRLTENGVRNREILRGGVVGDALFNICCAENADLLMLGAYGYGPQDRPTLGSTAEYLLRAIPCPALTYGPSVKFSFSSLEDKRSSLVPIFLPCEPAQLRQAVNIAKLFGVELNLLHVEDVADMRVHPHMVEDLERECRTLVSRLRQDGVQLQWSLLFGEAAEVINSRSLDLNSKFILMPLRWRKRLSSITSDNVAAHVIRSSKLPVMTYRID